MNKKTCVGIFIYLIYLVAPLIAFGQQTDITGNVVDAQSNAPLTGVSVSVKGKALSTQTDQQGAFVLRNVSPTDTLVFSFVGFSPYETAVGQRQTPLQVALTSISEDLDEVVVTAFGVSRAKKALGYAVQDVKAQELSTRPAN